MRVHVEWEYTESDADEMHWPRVLYSYLDQRTQDLLYIGKADRSSTKARLRGGHKDKIFASVADRYGVVTLSLQVGHIILPDGNNLTRDLLSDIESLLIHRIRPPWNKQCIKSRIEGPDLIVYCKGDWPLRKKTFRDN